MKRVLILLTVAGRLLASEVVDGFELASGVRRISAQALEVLRTGELPESHNGLRVNRHQLRDEIGLFFLKFPKPYCYSNDITVEELRNFSQKSYDELVRDGSAYTLAIQASFNNLQKFQKIGEVLQEIDCDKLFSDEVREGLLRTSYALERPGHCGPPASKFLLLIQVNDPWSSTLNKMAKKEAVFAKPTEETPLSGRDALRAIFANLIYDLIKKEVTKSRIDDIISKYKNGFAVAPILTPSVPEECLWKTYKVAVGKGVQDGCLKLPTEGQLFFKFPIESGSDEEKFCSLVPTFGFCWGGPGYLFVEEGSFDAGSFFDALWGGPGKRMSTAATYSAHIGDEKVIDVSHPVKEGFERFLFWRAIGGGCGEGLLVSSTSLPVPGEKKNVTMEVFLSGFFKADYYEEDHAGPAKNRFVFKNVRLTDNGVFNIDGKREFYIVEKKTS